MEKWHQTFSCLAYFLQIWVKWVKYDRIFQFKIVQPQNAQVVFSLTCLDRKFSKPSSFSFSSLPNLTSKLNCNAWSLLTDLLLNHYTLVQSCSQLMTKIPNKCCWGFFLQLMKSCSWWYGYKVILYMYHQPQWRQFTLIILVPVISNIKQGVK